MLTQPAHCLSQPHSTVYHDISTLNQLPVNKVHHLHPLQILQDILHQGNVHRVRLGEVIAIAGVLEHGDERMADAILPAKGQLL